MEQEVPLFTVANNKLTKFRVALQVKAFLGRIFAVNRGNAGVIRDIAQLGEVFRAYSHAWEADDVKVCGQLEEISNAIDCFLVSAVDDENMFDNLFKEVLPAFTEPLCDSESKAATVIYSVMSSVSIPLCDLVKAIDDDLHI